MENKTISAEPLLLLIWKNRKLFIITGILAVALSAAGSFMIPVKFKASCTMFPAKAVSLSIVERGIPAHGVELFGEEEEGERMLAILNSSALMNEVIAKFDLFKHYEIDPKGESKNDLMAAATKEHIKYERTRYGEVIVTVWDKDPKMAADIANFIANTVDGVKNKMIAEAQTENRKVLDLQYNDLLTQIKTLEDTMAKLRRIGVVMEEEPLAALIEQQTAAMIKGGSMAQEVNQRMDNNYKYGSVYSGFYQKLTYLTKRTEALKSNIDQLTSDINSTMKHKFMVDYAAPPDRKAYPVRWLVVAVSTVTSVFLLLVLLVILQKIKSLKAQEAA
jgi:uncharacterized protein involved in exopolysaccharide biosynthesis